MAYYLLAVTNAGEGMGRIYAGNFGLEGWRFRGLAKLPIIQSSNHLSMAVNCACPGAFYPGNCELIKNH